jgi:replicative DNA helicase
MDVAYEDRRMPEEILDYAEQQVFGVTERRVSSSPETLLEQIDALFKKVEDKQPHTGEETGFYELDDLLCGLQPSELIIVAGRPSMGKTALGLNTAENLALTQGKPTLFFSLEMSRQQVAQRILCSRARVDSHRLRRGRVTDQDLERLMEAADEISGKPLFVDDTSSLSILELRARARMAYRKHGVRVIFIDYLQLMHAHGYDTRQSEVAEISRGLKALAKELNVPVVAMAQLNRNPEDRTGNRPRMSDLRESGAIEQDADVVMLLHRESYYKTNKAVDDALQAGVGGGPRTAQAPEDTTAELIVAKQRNGPVGTIKLHFNKHWTRFDNHKPGQEYEGVREAEYYDQDVSFP